VFAFDEAVHRVDEPSPLMLNDNGRATYDVFDIPSLSHLPAYTPFPPADLAYMDFHLLNRQNSV
jgi:hypothetical protein